ncbi:alpha/beta hydrolase [Planctomicrobium piriforme]|uniref:Putative esterase n=1 Tax=Planctomicrobium piriforme TaxID=1576369 RepID=A0A1I3BM10_9PLAN|nr:alpha/beta hydrolase [Planctomicrobium piriforme]SFH63273.1 Putative esterase [Planctomicrobium piriforme]
MDVLRFTSRRPGQAKSIPQSGLYGFGLRRPVLFAGFVLCALLSQVALAVVPGGTISVRCDPQVQTAPYTGRVYLFFSEPRGAQTGEEPRHGPSWFDPQPFLSRDVTNWQPGEAVTFSLSDPAVRRFPAELTPEMLQGRQLQAVVRFNPHVPEIGTGPGNGYSAVAALKDSGPVELVVNSLVPEQAFPENQWTKLLRIRSDKLSRFHDRDVYLQGAVTLPASYYKEPQRRYPVIIEVPGFGGDHLHRVRSEPVKESNSHGVEFIRVMLDPKCGLGHHVFANSANNGPYGDALVEEFLPALNSQFRTTGTPEGRFLTGHSSGGWSSLWLQVNYPEQFAGTWSTAPDPVDFRDFQQIDLYRSGENMFTDPKGGRRPLARMRGEPIVFYDTFSQMEDVLGDGGQLRSFEAVFSRRGADGQPVQLWDRLTGKIDPAVAESWQPYDIRLQLEKNWPALGPKLQGKLHVYMGTEDTFYLEGATRLLKESLARMGSDAHVELIPGRNHMNLFADGLHGRIENEMAAKFQSPADHNLQNLK